MTAIPSNRSQLAKAKAGGRPPTIRWGPYLLLAPAFVFLVVFTIMPIFTAGFLSLFRYSLATRNQLEWGGLANYLDLFASPVFWTVVKNTLLFAAGTIPVSIALAMFLALQVNRNFAGRTLFRTLFFYPTVIPMMSAATIWLFMFTPGYGAINRILEAVGLPGVNFLGDTKTALLSIMVVTVWKQAGYFMVFFLAGMQNLPAELYEAASLDGASPWHQFRSITFPLLMPTTFFVSMVALIDCFKTVDQVFLMTTGGPNNATNLFLYHLYEQAFSFHDRGMASALTVVLVIILVAAAAFQLFVLDRRVHYN